MTVLQRHMFLSHSHLDNEFGTRLVLDPRRVLQDESAVWYDVLGSPNGGHNWWKKHTRRREAWDILIGEETRTLSTMIGLWTVEERWENDR